MKPTNQNIKKKSIREFAVMLGLCFFTALMMSYFLFSTPQSIYKDSFDRYNSFIAEHNALKMKTTSIATRIGDLLAIENEISKKPDTGLNRMADNVTKTLTEEIGELKSDSISGALPLHAQDLSNYLTLSKAVLSYHQNLKSLRQFLQLTSKDTTTVMLTGLLQKVAQLQSEKSIQEQANNQLREQIANLVSGSQNSTLR